MGIVTKQLYRNILKKNYINEYKEIDIVCVCVCALVRKSKAADQRRRSLAKQTREDHRRRSLKAMERGRVAAMTKAFGGEKQTPPPKPKPRNVTLTNEPLHRLLSFL